MAHWYGKIEVDNLNAERYYKASRIYADTKLANLLFTFELARKLAVEGFHNIIVNAVHPGPVSTGLFRNIPYYGWIIKFLTQILYYSPEVSFYNILLNKAMIATVEVGHFQLKAIQKYILLEVKLPFLHSFWYLFVRKISLYIALTVKKFLLPFGYLF